jgi:hypothetical protein
MFGEYVDSMNVAIDIVSKADIFEQIWEEYSKDTVRRIL